jgi:hypothetical protein
MATVRDWRALVAIPGMALDKIIVGNNKPNITEKMNNAGTFAATDTVASASQ